MESEKSRTEKMFQQARTLKVVATVMAVVLFLMALAALAYYVTHRAPR